MKKTKLTLFEIIILCCSALHLILGCIILFMGTIEQKFRRFPFWFSILCFLNGGLILILFLAIDRWKKHDISVDQSRHLTEYLVTAALFLTQIFVCYNTYFYTGWDCSIVLSASENIANGWDFSGSYPYFARCPNNLFITHLFGFLKHWVKMIGLTEKSHGMVMLIFFQCLLNSLTGLLLFRIICNLQERTTAWIGYLFYLILVGTSQWLLIPYSDSMVLIFPILLLYLWIQANKAKSCAAAPWWMGIGLSAAVGYHLKPHAVILFIAILLLEFFELIPRQPLRERSVKLANCLAGLLCFFLLFQAMEQRYYYRYPEISKEAILGASHYLMLGLNSETGGSFSTEDADFSNSFATAKERQQANFQVVKQRLADMRISGLLKHLVNKTCLNYEDGGGNWPYPDFPEKEYFYQHIPEEPIPYVSSILRNILYGHCLSNTIFNLIKQSTWLIIIFLITTGYCAFRKDKICAGCCLALLGLFLFSCLFEAGGRYKYSFLPIYCVLAAISLKEIRCRIRYLHGSAL